MEIKEYISDTIIQIVDGVRMAQEAAREVGAVVNAGDKYIDFNKQPNSPATFGSPNAQTIEFEIYLTADDSNQTHYGVKVFFQAIGAGAVTKHQTAEQTVNRVRFTVPVAFPPQK